MKKYLLILIAITLSNTAYWLDDKDQYCVDTYWVEVEHESGDYNLDEPFYDRKQRLLENEEKSVDTKCDDMMDLVYSYVYRTSWYSKYHVHLMLAENNYCDPYLPSTVSYYRWWYYHATEWRVPWWVYRDAWLCQLSKYYKPDFYAMKWAFDNVLWQADRCIHEIDIGTTFYARKHIYRWKNMIVKWLR